MNYPNLYYTRKGDNEFVDKYTAEASEDRKVIPGFTTSLKTRPIIIAKMEECIRNKFIGINSTRTIHELETFSWINGRPQANSGYTDDLVMALSIVCWVIETALQINKREQAYNQVMLTSMLKTTSKMEMKVPGQPRFK